MLSYYSAVYLIYVVLVFRGMYMCCFFLKVREKGKTRLVSDKKLD